MKRSSGEYLLLSVVTAFILSTLVLLVQSLLNISKPENYDLLINITRITAFVIFILVTFIYPILNYRDIKKKAKELEEELLQYKLKKNIMEPVDYEKSLSVKMGESDYGYDSAKYMIKTYDLLNKMTSVKLGLIETEKSINKVKEILDVYLLDRFAFAQLIYKYENSFKVISELKLDSLEMKLLIKNPSELDKKISTIVSSAHREIVEEKAADIVGRNLNYEFEILTELNKSNKKELI